MSNDVVTYCSNVSGVKWWGLVQCAVMFPNVTCVWSASYWKDWNVTMLLSGENYEGAERHD